MTKNRRYIDIHTHSLAGEEEDISVYNLSIEKKELLSPNYFSLGIHPWDVQRVDVINSMKLVENALQHSAKVFVGEIGLDRKCSVDFEKQGFVFQKQLELARKYRKPVIIHSVKAYSDIMQIVKKTAFDLPLIFHAYAGNEVQAQQLLQYKSYFSFGGSLLRHEKKAVALLKSLPMDRLFFETDTGSYSIKELYGAAAEILQIPVGGLQKRIYGNFTNVVDLLE